MRDAWRGRRSALAVPVALAIVSSLLLCSFPVPAQAKTEEEWKERTVYQIVSGLQLQQSRQSLGQASLLYSTAHPPIVLLLTPSPPCAAAHCRLRVLSPTAHGQVCFRAVPAEEVRGPQHALRRHMGRHHQDDGVHSAAGL